ncbi:MAG TPA: hypothetical protein VFV73_44040 [Streptosporangiaceae bacterium]|nr:hypothetical protein [Streptosporangiaceae bacterium]
MPVTSSVLGAVPAERSGMAASAANTSREFGAVTGIAILGAVVNAELRSGIVSRMTPVRTMKPRWPNGVGQPSS